MVCEVPLGGITEVPRPSVGTCTQLWVAVGRAGRCRWVGLNGIIPRAASVLSKMSKCRMQNAECQMQARITHVSGKMLGK